MSASSCSLDHSDKLLLLRWCEDNRSPSREEFVEIIEDRISEAVILSALSLVEATKVDLVGKYSTESGVVRSCRAFEGKFIVTILMNSQGIQQAPGAEFDPGILLIDSFMTEEQEASILDEIDNEIQRQQFRSLAGAKAYFSTCFSGTRCEGTAAWNRFLKFTARSSSSLVSNGVVQFWDKFRQQMAETCGPMRLPSSGAVGVPSRILPPEFDGPMSASIQ